MPCFTLRVTSALLPSYASRAPLAHTFVQMSLAITTLVSIPRTEFKNRGKSSVKLLCTVCTRVT